MLLFDKTKQKLTMNFVNNDKKNELLHRRFPKGVIFTIKLLILEIKYTYILRI